MVTDKNGKPFGGSDGKKIRVTTADGTYDGVVLGTYQHGDADGDVLPHVEREDGSRTMPAAGECELLDE